MPPLPRDQCAPYGPSDTHLTTFVRFRDLVEANIVRNWPSLLRLIDDEGFPPGIMLGKNSRAWALDDVEQWLATRPTARKTVPTSNNQKTKAEEASA